MLLLLRTSLQNYLLKSLALVGFIIPLVGPQYTNAVSGPIVVDAVFDERGAGSGKVKMISASCPLESC
jgi:hypothetical protein